MARSDTAAIAPPAAPAVIPSPGALANRHEAQESFDRARAALEREDFATSARRLAAAAAFIRTHAEEAELGATAALQGAAKELEIYSERVARGEVRSTRTLDRVFANANRAEAQHHLTRATAALSKRDYLLAGEELTMSVDHLERAAKDLHRRSDAVADTAFADARALAGQLMKGTAATRREARKVTEQLEAELRRICRIIDQDAAACVREGIR